MQLKPLFDRVILKQEKATEKSFGGIYLPTTSEDKSQIGIVVSVGDGGNYDAKQIEMQVKPGDKVLFSKFAGTEVKLNDENFLVIRQTDILAIFEKGDSK